jgi:AbrB family looped-hinge helix DNA binding protein
MASEERAGETAVNDRYAVTIPSAIRSRLDIQPGDRVRWAVTAEESLEIEIVKQRKGVFDDFEPIDAGPTDAAEDHDTVLAGEIEDDQ